MSSVRLPRRRNAILPTLGIAAVLIVFFAIYTGVWTDRLWYASMGYSSVFTTVLLTRIGLFLGFGLIMATAVAANAAVAHRMRPRVRLGAPTSPLLERYREVVESRFPLVVGSLAVLVGIFAGAAATGQVSTYLAWRNRTPFGVTDPKFHLDVSFFVFSYPWWRFFLSFAFVTLLFSAGAAAVVHYVMGALRVTSPRRGVTAAAQAQLSILVGLAVAVKGVSYWFDQYGLEIADHDRFTGINYTANHATVNAKVILAVIAVLCALMFWANAVLRRWMVPTIGLTLLILSVIVLGAVYPGAVQAFSVRPDEPDKERPYIAQNIAATRAAYGVDKVQITNYNSRTTATAGQLQNDAEALPGIRLIDPSVVAQAYEQLQQVRGYYSFKPVLDVDRYTINGVQTDAVVAAREMDLAGLDQKNWNNIHTVYTHGYGLVAAYGNRRQANGDPQWIVRDIPPVGLIPEHEPRIYYGSVLTDFSIVGTSAGKAPIELDTPGGGKNGNPKLFTYDGTGGVPIGSFWNRLLYATKFFDVNLLLSDRVNSDSKIIYDRTPRERVLKAAPWLQADADAYPAVVDGRIVWIVDGYTTSNSYPNSQRVSLEDATSDSQTSRVGTVTDATDTKVNYIRNSVKATVDAYDGTVKLYAWDDSDPVLRTWEKAFPGTVLPKSEISKDLLSHLRYPEDLYKVQRQILARYHVTEPNLWYQATDLWQIPNDPNPDLATSKEPPYYLSVKWPGDPSPLFSLTSLYVPNQRQNLAAYMAVNADASSPNYGQLRILRMLDTSQIDGPGQSFNAMTTDEVVAGKLRPFLAQGSSTASYGNLLTLPVGGGLLYVQPIYTQRQGSSGSYPALRYVVVRFGQSVGIGDTLQAALTQVFSTAPATGSGDGGGTTSPTTSPTQAANNAAAAKALNEAQAAFTAAQKALSEGNLALYQAKNDEAKADVARALKALGQ